jgi:Surface-adhesin protein E
MNLVKVAAFALATAISIPEFSQANEPDWRVAGYTDKSVFLYSVPDIVREPNGLVRVWLEELNLKASERAADRAANERGSPFVDAVAGRVARYYVPPLMLAGIVAPCKSSKDSRCLANYAMNIAGAEETANEHLVHAEKETLYELDCSNKRARVLQLLTYPKGRPPQFASTPSSWLYAPPQSLLESLLTIVCNPAVAAIDNTPLKPRPPAGPSKKMPH